MNQKHPISTLNACCGYYKHLQNNADGIITIFNYTGATIYGLCSIYTFHLSSSNHCNLHRCWPQVIAASLAPGQAGGSLTSEACLLTYLRLGYAFIITLHSYLGYNYSYICNLSGSLANFSWSNSLLCDFTTRICCCHVVFNYFFHHVDVKLDLQSLCLMSSNPYFYAHYMHAILNCYTWNPMTRHVSLLQL